VTRFEVFVLPEAEVEAREAFLWYFERSPLAADASGLSCSAPSMAWLQRQPIGRWMKTARRYHLQHFPYTLVYEVDGTTATVLAIAHQRRRPRYWLT